VYDRYIEGTRLRLRRVEEAGQPLQLKLGQKIRLESGSPRAVAHTTMYLDVEEFEKLAALPAAELVKVRRHLVVGPAQMAVDQFEGRLHGLVLAETEEPAISVQELAGPLGVVAEVTDDDRFSGATLAHTETPSLRELLEPFR
jgi:CYTH domain-containing protein